MFSSTGCPSFSPCSSAPSISTVKESSTRNLSRTYQPCYDYQEGVCIYTCFALWKWPGQLVHVKWTVYKSDRRGGPKNPGKSPVPRSSSYASRRQFLSFMVLVPAQSYLLQNLLVPIHAWIGSTWFIPRLHNARSALAFSQGPGIRTDDTKTKVTSYV